MFLGMMLMVSDLVKAVHQLFVGHFFAWRQNAPFLDWKTPQVLPGCQNLRYFGSSGHFFDPD